MISGMLEAVMRYVMQDVVVFPCAKKKPLTANGFKDASLHPEDLSRWWTQWPAAQIGLPTGSVNHLFVVDVDSSAAAEYVEKLKLAETFTVETRPRRFQLWFDQPAGATTKCTSGDLVPGLDTRGDGGYTIAPPSIHHLTGQPYKVVKDLPWAPMPQSLIELFSATNGHDQASTAPDSIPQGRRHRTMLQMAGALRARGLAPSSVLAALVVVNQQHCIPPLEMAELEKLAAYVGTKPAGNRSTTMETTTAEIELEYYDQIGRERVKWLWAKRIPRGKLTIFAGNPGVGKSLTSVDVVSHVSRGAAYPDGSPCEQGESLILSAEDSEEDTIGPRLDAAQADCRRVARIKAVKVTLADGSQGESFFSLERDLEKLEEKIKKNPSIVLIVIDPLTAYLGRVDSHRDAEVRQVLTPLVEFAKRTGVAIIAIMHLRKAETAALLRVSGSIGFVAAARVVWGFGEDPDDPSLRVMVPVINKLAPKGTGLAYRISTTDDCPFIAWQAGAVHLTADDVLSGAPQQKQEPGALERAMEYLEQEVLADGPKLVKDIEAQITRAGYKWRTIERAKEKLKLKIKADKNSMTGGWSWRLTTAEERHEGCHDEPQ